MARRAVRKVKKAVPYTLNFFGIFHGICCTHPRPVPASRSGPARAVPRCRPAPAAPPARPCHLGAASRAPDAPTAAVVSPLRRPGSLHGRCGRRAGRSGAAPKAIRRVDCLAQALPLGRRRQRRVPCAASRRHVSHRTEAARQGRQPRRLVPRSGRQTEGSIPVRPPAAQGPQRCAQGPQVPRAQATIICLRLNVHTHYIVNTI